MNILVTGAAGFIGFHLITCLLDGNESNVYGIDNLNDYYDPSLKRMRLAELRHHKNSENFIFFQEDISDRELMAEFFANYNFDVVVNLAAQAGVRHSIENPNAYVDSNLVGFLNILEGSRHSKVGHLVYASSSSVYGMNSKQPFGTGDVVDFPISLYAATKKANEVMAHSYSHLYDLPTTGLRFFTVYGPYGRPDMAYHKFTESILKGEAIDVYNNGDMRRDFTYIDDIIEGLMRLMKAVPGPMKSDKTYSNAPYAIYNIGNNDPVRLDDFIRAIENSCERKAIKNFLPMQPGDVPVTSADIDELDERIGFRPSTTIEDGIAKYVKWHKHYRNTKNA